MTVLTVIVETANGVVRAATPSPGYPAYEGNPDLITPGVVGFFAIFAIAVATVLLLVDMNRRIRRVRYRAEVQEQLRLEAEEAARAESKRGSRKRGGAGTD